MSRKDKTLWWLAEKYVQVKELVREFPEFLGLPLLLVVFYFNDSILKIFDKDALPWTFDSVGVLFISPIIVLAINCFTFIGFKLNFPQLYKAFLEADFKNLPTWQIFLFSLSVILIYLLLFLTVTLVIAT